MKLCLICFAQNDEKVATCAACGEGSFTANPAKVVKAPLPAVRSVPPEPQSASLEPKEEPAEPIASEPVEPAEPAERPTHRRRR